MSRELSNKKSFTKDCGESQSTDLRSFELFLHRVIPQDPPVGNVRQSLPIQTREGRNERSGTACLGDGASWNIHVISSTVEGSVFRIDHCQGGQGFPSPPPTLFTGVAQKKFRLYAGQPGRHPPSHYTTSMSSSAWNSRRLEQVRNSGIPQVPLPHFPNEDEKMGGRTYNSMGCEEIWPWPLPTQGGA